MSKTYSEKLRDPRWQKKRLEILEAAGWKCRMCRTETKELQVHHLIYRNGKDPWDYDQRELIALCKDCHEMIPNLELVIMAALTRLHPTTAMDFAGMCLMSAKQLHDRGYVGECFFARHVHDNALSEWMIGRMEHIGKKLDDFEKCLIAEIIRGYPDRTPTR